MKPFKSYLPFLTAGMIFLALTFLPLFADEQTLDKFAREDGVFEDLTALYLFGTGVIFAAALYFFRSAPWLLRLCYLGLALLFFFGAGEEISWGERIFDWDDHNLIKGVNVQEELTIHNLKYFQGEESVLPVSVAQIFTVFVFLFAVIIPVACRLSPRLQQFLAPRFPILPWQFGSLVVLTYLLQKGMSNLLPMFPELYRHPTMPIPQGIHEIREHGYTFALLLSALFFFLGEMAVRRWKEVRQQDPIQVSVSD